MGTLAIGWPGGALGSACILITKYIDYIRILSMLKCHYLRGLLDSADNALDCVKRNNNLRCINATKDQGEKEDHH